MPKEMDDILDQVNSLHRRLREQEEKLVMIKSSHQLHCITMLSQLKPVLGQVKSLQEECANLMNECDVRTADLIHGGENHIEKAAQSRIALEQELYISSTGFGSFEARCEPASVVLCEERSSYEKTVGDVPVQSEENKNSTESDSKFRKTQIIEGKSVVAFETDGDEARQQIQPEKTSEVLED